ncbi:unnamed protein product [Closterium sp. NIES-53]
MGLVWFGPTRARPCPSPLSPAAPRSRLSPETVRGAPGGGIQRKAEGSWARERKKGEERRRKGAGVGRERGRKERKGEERGRELGEREEERRGKEKKGGGSWARERKKGEERRRKGAGVGLSVVWSTPVGPARACPCPCLRCWSGHTHARPCFFTHPPRHHAPPHNTDDRCA